MISAALPAALGVALYTLNNLGALHALIAAPEGYVAMGIDRNVDVAQHLTWIAGFTHRWVLPDYQAAWRTEPALIVPSMLALAKVSTWGALNPVVTLEAFAVLCYVLACYAAAFALRTFCNSRREAFAAIICAFACVPLTSILQFPEMLLRRPDWQHYGVYNFLAATDGFMRGPARWPLLTFGAFTVLLAIPLAARYLSTRDRKWLWFLAGDCFFSALVHPFEIFPILAATVILLLRYRSPGWRTVLSDLSAVCTASAAGLAVYIIPTLRYSWIREVNAHNRVSYSPTYLLAYLGIPVIASVLLLLLGFPRTTDLNAGVLKVWFAITLLVFYSPKIPWPPHTLDGFCLLAGLLLVYQLREVRQLWQPSLRVRRLIAVTVTCALALMIIPHFTFRALAWSGGVNADGRYPFEPAIALQDEAQMVEWFRKNVAQDKLVLAPREQAAWVATAPIHSFGAHWLFSLLTPAEQQSWDAFYSGRLSHLAASAFLDAYGFSFVVVRPDSPALQYLGGANLAASTRNFEIFKLSDAGLKDRTEVNRGVALVEQLSEVCASEPSGATR